MSENVPEEKKGRLLVRFYDEGVERVLEELSASAEGLSAAEASKRLERDGKNRLAEAKKDSLLKRLLKQMADPMIIILIVAAAISGVLAVVEGESLADVVIIMAVVIGLTAGYDANKIASTFVDGAKVVLVGALVTGFSKGISVILADANITDTIVHALSSLVVGLPTQIGAMAMLLVQSVLNCFIISSSGQAAATIPIMSPLGDVLGLTQQTVVMAFLYGDGFSGELDPGFGAKIAGEGVKDKNLAILDTPSYENLCRFVMEYADGVVAASPDVDPKVLDMARASGKPMLEYQSPEAEDFFDNYNRFYEAIQ